MRWRIQSSFACDVEADGAAVVVSVPPQLRRWFGGAGRSPLISPRLAPGSPLKQVADHSLADRQAGLDAAVWLKTRRRISERVRGKAGAFIISHRNRSFTCGMYARICAAEPAALGCRLPLHSEPRHP